MKIFQETWIINIDGKTKWKVSDCCGHEIIKSCNIWIYVLFARSKAMLDILHQKHCVRVAWLVAEQFKTKILRNQEFLGNCQISVEYSIFFPEAKLWQLQSKRRQIYMKVFLSWPFKFNFLTLFDFFSAIVDSIYRYRHRFEY